MVPGRLGRPLGRPGWPLDVSGGSSGRAKEIFGRRFGTPWNASGALGVTKCTPGRKGSDLGFIRVHFFLLPCMLRGLGVGCARTKL